MEQSGDVHIAVYDFGERRVYFSLGIVFNNGSFIENGALIVAAFISPSDIHASRRLGMPAAVLVAEHGYAPERGAAIVTPLPVFFLHECVCVPFPSLYLQAKQLQRWLASKQKQNRNLCNE